MKNEYDDVVAELLAAKERAADAHNRIDVSDMTSDQFIALLRESRIMRRVFCACGGTRKNMLD